MSAATYLELAQKIYDRIRATQMENIQKAGQWAAGSISRGGLVHLFGSGHSVIPALDIFPRYGSFAGFHPLLDARLMWFQVVGSGGVRELLKLERIEGYVQSFFSNFKFDPLDSMVIFSHGGQNAAPVEAALHAKSVGMKLIAVTSLENARISRATHSSGKKLADLADMAIDNCCPPQDTLLDMEGGPVAASSTFAAIAISMALLAETAARLREGKYPIRAFVSPNVSALAGDNNQMVFEDYVAKLDGRHR